MTELEVAELIEWAAVENWNPGWDEGFLAIEVAEQLAGGGSIVRHNSNYGFMGLFILRPQFRGQGLGKQLWFARRDRLLSRLDTGGCIGLDAVTAMIPFYEQGGFRAHFKSLRFHTPAGSPVSRQSTSLDSPNVVPLSQTSWHEVLALDEVCFPGKRENYLRAWLAQPRALGLGYQENAIWRGYAVMRPCRSGCKIGPLFGETSSIASILLDRCLQLAGDHAVCIDVPENNRSAVQLCQTRGMQPIFECTRMFFGPAPAMRLNWVYGLTSFELG
jgi:GNAT superfamily N-acetyltransferase